VGARGYGGVAEGRVEWACGRATQGVWGVVAVCGGPRCRQERASVNCGGPVDGGRLCLSGNPRTWRASSGEVMRVQPIPDPRRRRKSDRLGEWPPRAQSTLLTVRTITVQLAAKTARGSGSSDRCHSDWRRRGLRQDCLEDGSGEGRLRRSSRAAPHPGHLLTRKPVAS